MEQQPDSGGLIALQAAQFETLLERAAETGARRSLLAGFRRRSGSGSAA
jgi:hypothetical protein